MRQARNNHDMMPLNNAAMTSTSLRRLPALFGLTAIGLVLSGCMVGPNYKRPDATPAGPAPMAFKEADGWKQAAPSDQITKEDWWRVFNDPVLNDLEAKVAVNNQNVVGAEAAYREARALLDQQNATLWPTVSLTGTATHSKSAANGASFGSTTTTSGTGGSTSGTGTTGSGTSTGSSTSTGSTATTTGSTTTAGRAVDTYTARLGATWDLDVWGRLRRGIEAAGATAQASAADYANAKLSAQILLAADYFQMREADEEKRLIDQTVGGYSENLRIANNRFSVGVGARADVLTAQTTLKSAQASAVDLVRTRAQFEHAIAVLSGQAPADLTVQLAPWTLNVPAIPVSMPSTLLERRPDIAGAERRMKAANAQIGVQTAGFFPDLTLSGQYGFSASTLSKLFNAGSNSWSIGANAVQTVFDAGATAARVRQYRAAYDASVATYRQTVLTAFQQVEDNIAALRVLQAEYDLDLAASQEADEAEKITNNQYQAGQVDFTTVVVAQNTALAARRTAIQAARNQMVALVDLISALGGGWNQTELAQK
jgi:NodT family efflux transporter outer membrane factor (OMF) lipoprotein